MAINSLRINHEGDSIQLFWQRGQSTPLSAPAVIFEHPFDEQALADLRWYLEEYLRFPYGIYPDNATKIEQQFQEWGKQLFELVFRSNEKAREFFQAATYEGLDRCELVITSDSPEVLNLPWELLYSPSDRTFLAPSLAGMSRSLSDYAVRAQMRELPQDKLNILLVIARPYGEKDIALKTIARPLLAAIADIRTKVNIKVLRPPSFEQFERELNANKGFYHIVHFDGHGDFDPDSTGFKHTLGGAGQGVLVFEADDGSPQIVTAEKIAQNLADCGVPIFVLNACKSAEEGEEKFSSVATRLVSLGAKGVVAMAYSVYADAAKHFIGRLYGELVRGESLDRAVALGRREVLNKPLRPSPKGDKPLQDWLVPVLYQQESYKPFIPTDETDYFDDEPVSNLVDLPQEGRYGFIGRDYDILSLERAFRQNNVVLLQGMGGVGKTELACGFARWLDETQGRSLIFFTSFEHGAGLSHIVNQVGRQVWGGKFSQYPAEKQQTGAINYLKKNPCLLIWDNFEPVAGFPAGNEALLSASERDNLQWFLKQLRGGKSWVLITSRREEAWLDCGYKLLNLRGLREQDVEELAAKILDMVGVDRKNLPQEYLELLKLLGGHPLSLRVVLPHLKTQTPVQLIEALRCGLDTFKGMQEEGRDRSLTGSLDYSFAKLSQRARQHLPFLALFSERVDANHLDAFSAVEQLGQSYQATFGEKLQKADWLKILNEAAEAGILEPIDATVYKIHPALPWYLRYQLANRHTETEVSEIEKKLVVFYALLANYYRKQLLGNAQTATTILLIEEPNLLQNLRVAEKQQDWKNVQLILQTLGIVYERKDRQQEFRMLQKRSLNQLGRHLAEAKAKGKDAFELWTHLRGVDTKDALLINDLGQARAIYQEILDELTAINDPSMNDKIAVATHNLGIVAQQQNQLDEAIAHFQTARQMFEDKRDFYQAANVYHHLGMLAEKQQQFTEAIAHFQKACSLRKKAGDLYLAASDIHHLGMVAQKQKHFDKAIAYYKETVQIYQDVGTLFRAAPTYHQLGIMAHDRGDFEAARAFFLTALKIYEDANNCYQAAKEYQSLGALAQEQNDFAQAIAYFKKALPIYKNSGTPYEVANIYHHIGMVVMELDQIDKAIEYYQITGQIYEDEKCFSDAANVYHLLGLVAFFQKQFDEASTFYQKAWEIFYQFKDWYKASITLCVWGNALKAQENWDEALQIYIEALEIDLEHNQHRIDLDIKNLGRMLKVMGETQFEAIWCMVTGEDCAGEVREEIWAARDNLEG